MTAPAWKAATTAPTRAVRAPLLRARRRPRVLFVGGTLNATSMMHQVAEALCECACYFTPLYADGALRLAAERGLLEFTTLGNRMRLRTEAYLHANALKVDPRGERRAYDLVVSHTDLVVPRNVRGRPLIVVQEGMMDPEDQRYRLVRALRLPRYLANTSTTGLSHAYDAFCVASAGFRDVLIRKGVDARRIEVTGIPNFDDVQTFLSNDFEHRGHVLAVTSHLRETLKYENRPAFIRKALRVADGRTLIFKLHPSERHARATREIRRLAPGALIYANGNTNHMVANASAVVTRYSSVALVAVALGKETHADIDPAVLQRLCPLQTGGTSARQIAAVCRRYL